MYGRDFKEIFFFYLLLHARLLFFHFLRFRRLKIKGTSNYQKDRKNRASFTDHSIGRGSFLDYYLQRFFNFLFFLAQTPLLVRDAFTAQITDEERPSDIHFKGLPDPIFSPGQYWRLLK